MLKQIFYRIRQKDWPLFYNGCRLKTVRNHYGFYRVEDAVVWSKTSFYTCTRLDTAKHHIGLIKDLQPSLDITDDLILEKCTIGKVEEISIKDIIRGQNAFN